MLLKELEITQKQTDSTLVAYIRFNLKSRSEIPDVLQELAQAIPAGEIAGAPYFHIQHFSSYTEGFEVELGFPVLHSVESGRVKSKVNPALEVLALTHQGSPDALRETKLKLHDFTRQHALISDEFSREVFLDWHNPQGAIEVQFVIHNWNIILDRNLERVLGSDERTIVMEGAETITLESSPEERFAWAKSALHRLDGIADEHQKYDAVSSCAHVFPPEQLEKLKQVYEAARGQSDDPLEAVDAVSAFMEGDPGWSEKDHYRVGRVLYHTKHPLDREAYASAKTDEERRAAYCFCPVIRTRLDQGMPVSYCYCGSGWYRQQWETATGKPVTVDVVQSVLKGDMVCQFAVHLSDEL